MIINLLQASGAPVSAGEFTATVSPSVFRVKVANGNYTTPFFEVSQQNGVGPFEYLWTQTSNQGNSVVINNETSERTNLNVGSYNSEVEIELSCEITDKGNSDEKKTAKSRLFITFGNNLL